MSFEGRLVVYYTTVLPRLGLDITVKTATEQWNTIAFLHDS